MTSVIIYWKIQGLLYLKHASHLEKNIGAHYYVLDFQTIIFPLKTVGGTIYYYKVEHVHYVAVVILEMDFITYLFVSFKNERKRYLPSFCKSKPNTLSFIKYLTL